MSSIIFAFCYFLLSSLDKDRNLYYNILMGEGAPFCMSLFANKLPPVEFIVAGLGNPGEKYRNTRHNTGFRAVDYLSGRTDTKINKLRHMALTGRCGIEGKGVLLMKPQTYMNESGNAVRDAASFYKVKPQNIIVIFDDCSLPVGAHRIRKNGSAGGHNGVKSIIECLGTNDFPRIKIGIGEKPNPDYDLADYVLSELTSAEAKIITADYDRMFEALCYIINGETDKAMNRYN